MKRTRPTVVYQRLPGLARGLLGYTRLYVGPDHLLQVEVSGYTETYKRFYFRDIQALMVVRTGYWSASTAVLALGGAVALILAGLCAAAGDPDLVWAAAVLIAVGLSCAVGLGIGFLTGPGCRCVIRTAVQTERLPSLGKYRRALQTLARLRPLIEQAQATLAPGASPASSQPGQPEAPPVMPADQPPRPPGPAPDQASPAQPES